MYKKILFIVMILMAGFLSCYDGVLDTYDNDADYEIGDRGPAGGWIFYINPNYETDGWRYLEAAPYDQSQAAAWVPSDITITTYAGLGKGYGDTNTVNIIAAAGNSGSYAAKLCADLVLGGYSDWYLPTLQELRYMAINLYDNSNIGNFTNLTGNGRFYWSSENSYDPMAANYPINDSSNVNPEGNGSPQTQSDFHVRAVRAF